MSLLRRLLRSVFGNALSPPSPCWQDFAGRRLLHVGCGHASLSKISAPGFQDPASPWHEIRLDADASVHPDIVGTMTAMPDVPDAAVDAVYSSHGIEHLYWHDVPCALAEFNRVLRPEGLLVITCPDLQAAARMVAEDRLFDTAYESGAGPITPFDIIFSYRPYVQANPEWMTHRCGFTLTTLTEALRQAGFASIHGIRRLAAFDLWLLASKSPRSDEAMSELAKLYLPVADQASMADI